MSASIAHAAFVAALTSCLTLPAAFANAYATQDLASLTRLATEWLRAQAASRYTDVDIEVEVAPPDARLRLVACPEPRFSLAQGSHPWGKGSLGMRCQSPTTWSLYTAYTVRLAGPALVSKHAARARQTLNADDMELRRTAYQADPDLYPRDPTRVQGSQLTVPVAPGTAIRADMLRRPPAIKAGQRVRLVAEGPGFRIGQEGVAQQAGAVGDLVRVKTSGGKIVSGTVQADGTVRAHP